MISEEELKKFDDIYKDEGEIDKFVKRCRKELKDPEIIKFQGAINNKRIMVSQKASKGNVNLNSIKDTAQLEKNIKSTTNLAIKAKIAQSNIKFVEQCKAQFDQIGDENPDDNPEALSNEINSYKDDLLTTYKDDQSLRHFYQELYEYVEITKVQLQNLSDSTKFQSSCDFYKMNPF